MLFMDTRRPLPYRKDIPCRPLCSFLQTVRSEMPAAHLNLFNGCSYEFGGFIRLGNSTIVMDGIRRLTVNGLM